MRKINVCLSPELIHRYEIRDKIVVVTDVLRATSCMVTAFAHGASRMVPVTDAEECKKMKQRGYIISGEQDGLKIAGFDKGNSPFEYMDDTIRESKIALRTTNGTRVINEAKEAKQLLIGAFLNIDALADYLIKADCDILVLCSGWKGDVNTEDSLFAGALIDKLKGHVHPERDAPIIAQRLYRMAKDNVMEFLTDSSHVQRLIRLNLCKDIEFCLTPNQYDVVPMLKKNYLIL